MATIDNHPRYTYHDNRCLKDQNTPNQHTQMPNIGAVDLQRHNCYFIIQTYLQDLHLHKNIKSAYPRQKHP